MEKISCKPSGLTREMYSGGKRKPYHCFHLTQTGEQVMFQCCAFQFSAVRRCLLAEQEQEGFNEAPDVLYNLAWLGGGRRRSQARGCIQELQTIWKTDIQLGVPFHTLNYHGVFERQGHRYVWLCHQQSKKCQPNFIVKYKISIYLKKRLNKEKYDKK